MNGMLALITPVDADGNPVDPGYGKPVGPGHPSLPIVLPPLPPGFEVPDNSLPVGPVHPSYPIALPIGPDNTLPLPPGTIYPPLNPSDGVSGKCLLLVFVVGTEGHRYRWIVVDAPEIWPPTTPQPK